MTGGYTRGQRQADLTAEMHVEAPGLYWIICLYNRAIYPGITSCCAKSSFISLKLHSFSLTPGMYDVVHTCIMYKHFKM